MFASGCRQVLGREQTKGSATKKRVRGWVSVSAATPAVSLSAVWDTGQSRHSEKRWVHVPARAAMCGARLEGRDLYTQLGSTAQAGTLFRPTRLHLRRLLPLLLR